MYLNVSYLQKGWNIMTNKPYARKRYTIDVSFNNDDYNECQSVCLISGNMLSWTPQTYITDKPHEIEFIDIFLEHAMYENIIQLSFRNEAPITQDIINDLNLTNLAAIKYTQIDNGLSYQPQALSKNASLEEIQEVAHNIIDFGTSILQWNLVDDMGYQGDVLGHNTEDLTNAVGTTITEMLEFVKHIVGKDVYLIHSDDEKGPQEPKLLSLLF